jgi:hypothetical protein
MKDFSVVTLSAVAWEFFAPWFWYLVVVAAVAIVAYAVAALRSRSAAEIWRSGFFPAALVAILFGAVMFAATPMLTDSGWRFVSGAVDLIFVGLVALGFAAAMFVIVLPVASLLRTKGAS